MRCKNCCKKFCVLLDCKSCDCSYCTRCIDMSIHDCKNIDDYKFEQRKKLKTTLENQQTKEHKINQI